MEEAELGRTIEAILLVAVEPLAPQLLAELLEEPVERVDEAIDRLARDYQEQDRGFMVARIAGGARFQTHPDLAPYVERFANRDVSHRLSTAALETLAIVAYRQPVSRGQISALRGVNVDGVSRLLEQRGYIAVIGHADGPGQPALFGTTDLFLERLGLDSLAQLPAVEDFLPAPTWRPTSSATCSPPWGWAWRRAPTTPEDEGERLQKVLARAGFGSRRACEELIAAGRVTVDGTKAVLGQRVDVATARVEVDGSLVPVAPDLVYYLLNKPDDVITTADDPQGRRTVLSLVPAEPRVFAVGRLDRHTEGLLVLTNDGALSQLLTHPSHGVAKEYVAEVRGGTPAPGALRTLRRGVELSDGVTLPAEVGVLAPGVLRLVIHEGRNRQVRRMCEAVGHPVERLVRTRIGPLRDTTLAPGHWRPLGPEEVRALAAAASHA